VLKNKLHNIEKLLSICHSTSNNIQLIPEDQSKIGFANVTGGTANCDQTPSLGEAF